jgi:hypothetical protein
MGSAQLAPVAGGGGGGDVAGGVVTGGGGGDVAGGEVAGGADGAAGLELGPDADGVALDPAWAG